MEKGDSTRLHLVQDKQRLRCVLLQLLC